MVTVITFADILYAVMDVTYVINHITILIKWTKFAYRIFKALNALSMKYVDQKCFVKLYVRKSYIRYDNRKRPSMVFVIYLWNSKKKYKKNKIKK